MNNNNNAHVETAQAELVDIFMDFSEFDFKTKDKSTAQQRLAARRAIEQHFEKKRLEHDIQDYWFDD